MVLIQKCFVRQSRRRRYKVAQQQLNHFDTFINLIFRQLAAISKNQKSFESNYFKCRHSQVTNDFELDAYDNLFGSSPMLFLFFFIYGTSLTCTALTNSIFLHIMQFVQYQLDTSQYQMGLISIIKLLSTVLRSVVNYSRLHEEKIS